MVVALVAAGQAQPQAGGYLWVLTQQHTGLEGPRLELVDVTTTAIQCEANLGGRGLEAEWLGWLGGGGIGPRLCVMLRRTPGPANAETVLAPTVTELRFVDLDSLSLGRSAYTWDFASYRATAVPARRRLYLAGIGEETNYSRSIQFDANWQVEFERPAEFHSRAVLSADGNYLWYPYRTEEDAGLKRLDLVSDLCDIALSCPGEHWWPGRPVPTPDGRVYVSGYRDGTDGPPEERAVFVWAPGDEGLSRAPLTDFSLLLAYAPFCDGMWLLTGRGDQEATLQLRACSNGETLLTLAVKDWTELNWATGITLDGGRRLVMVVPGEERRGGWIAIADSERRTVGYVDPEGARVVDAVPVNLTSEQVERLRGRARAAAPQPLRELPWPTQEQIAASRVPWQPQEVERVTDALPVFVREEWQPTSLPDNATHLVGWSPMPDCALLHYRIKSHNEVPSWRVDCRWLLNLAPSGSPVLAGRVTGKGGWLWQFLLTEEEAAGDRTAVDSGLDTLFDWPAVTTVIDDPPGGISRSWSRDWLTEYERLTPDGRLVTCYRTRFRDWTLYGWADRTEGLTLCYQFEPIVPPPEP